VANWFSARKALHLASADGITNWKNMGLAYDPTANFVRYTDGTVNHWYNMERPGVLIENGHVTHFTFAVVDVPKSQELGNDQNGSKVIVVPFNGAAFDGVTSNHANGVGPVHTSDISFTVKGARKTFFIPADAVNGENRLSVAVYDLKGRLIAHEFKGTTIGKNQEVNLDFNGSRVVPGVYCIVVKYENRNFYGRLSVE
jgi:hypothetical protein